MEQPNDVDGTAHVVGSDIQAPTVGLNNGTIVNNTFPLSWGKGGYLAIFFLILLIMILINGMDLSTPPATGNCTIQASEISVERVSLQPNDQVKVSVRAENPDGRVLIYTWQAVSGQVVPAGRSSAAEVLYTAPASPTDDTISVNISMEGCDSVRRSRQVAVMSVQQMPTRSSAEVCRHTSAISATLTIAIVSPDGNDPASINNMCDMLSMGLYEELQLYQKDVLLYFTYSEALIDYKRAKEFALQSGYPIVIWYQKIREDVYVPNIVVIDPIEQSDLSLEFRGDGSSDPDVMTEQFQASTNTALFFVRAIVSMYAKNYDGALIEIDKAIKLARSHSHPIGVLDTLYFYKGRLSALRGDKSGAIQAYNQSVSINNKYMWSHLGLTLITFTMALTPATGMDISRMNEAINSFNSILTVYDTNAGTLFPYRDSLVVAKTYYNLGNAYSYLAQEYQRRNDEIAFNQYWQWSYDAYTESILVYKQEQDEGRPVSNHRIAKIHFGLGILYRIKGDTTKELAENAQCLKFAQDINMLGLLEEFTSVQKLCSTP